MKLATGPSPGSRSDQTLLLLLRLGTFLCFAGWAWVHLYWEGPYGVLLWNETTYALANRLGISWEEFVGSGADDGLVQRWVARIGWLYLLSALLALTVRTTSKVQMAVLAGGGVLLTVLSYAKYAEADHQLPMFIEHGGQILMAPILVTAMVLGVRHRVTVTMALVAFIMTFAGHGCYAIGFSPTPANYQAMITLLFHVGPGTTVAILKVAGVLDFVACIGLFVPRLRLASAAYGVGWGLLTALARPAAGMSWSLIYWGADQYLHETVLRAPHFFIPLFLLLVWKQPAPTPPAVADAEAHPDGPHLLHDKPGFCR